MGECIVLTMTVVVVGQIQLNIVPAGTGYGNEVHVVFTVMTTFPPRCQILVQGILHYTVDETMSFADVNS
jgi:hypothetical protein